MQVPKNASETRCFYYWLLDGNVFFVQVKAGAEVEAEDASEMLKALYDSMEEDGPKVLVNTNGVRTITKEARRLFSLVDRQEIKTKAIALVVGTPVSRVIGNFFIGINKPRVPTKMFNTEEDALEWLKEFSDEANIKNSLMMV